MGPNGVNAELVESAVARRDIKGGLMGTIKVIGGNSEQGVTPNTRHLFTCSFRNPAQPATKLAQHKLMTICYELTLRLLCTVVV